MEFSHSEFSEVFSVLSAGLGQIAAKATAKRTFVQIPEGRTNYLIDIIDMLPSDTVSHDYYYVLHSSANFVVTKGPPIQNYPTTSVSFGTNV